jgi:hypothetical protein
MRQNSRVEPSNQPSSAIALHPVLSLALANLDIQLEDELVRYRRQRTLTGRAGTPPKRNQPSHQLDLIAIAATSDQSDRNNLVEAARSAPALDERLTGIAAQTAIAPDAYKPIPAFNATPQPFEAAIALRAPAAPLTQDASTEPLPLVDDKAHALAHANNPNLDDYLESSEELLRSLADEQAEVRAERNFMQSLITPLGLGSMLLLLLSSAMFGYVIMNPSSLGSLIAWRSGNGDSVGTPSPSSGQPVMPPPQPDLAARELQKLNLDNLGTLNAGPGSPTTPGKNTQPIANAQPNDTAKTTVTSPKTSQESSTPVGQAPIPAVTSSSSRPASVRTYAPPQAPTPSRSAVAPSRPVPKTYSAPVLPSTTRATAPTEARSTSNNAYPVKVITPYDSDSTLAKSRTVVPDAYLRNFPDGAKIQLGAYSDTAAAEAKVQELRSRGIPAEVYKP